MDQVLGALSPESIEHVEHILKMLIKAGPWGLGGLVVVILAFRWNGQIPWGRKE